MVKAETHEQALSVPAGGELRQPLHPARPADLRRGRCHEAEWAHGLVLAFGYRYRFPIAGAFTVGNVVLTRRDSLEDQLIRHEGRHATQWAWCAGLPMLPLYLVAMLMSVVVCGHQASYNVFERLAGLDDGGYPRAPLWWGRGAGRDWWE